MFVLRSNVVFINGEDRRFTVVCTVAGASPPGLPCLARYRRIREPIYHEQWESFSRHYVFKYHWKISLLFSLLLIMFMTCGPIEKLGATVICGS